MERPNHKLEAMIFRPTMYQMRNLRTYYEWMLSQGAHRGGIAKIIPPKEYRARATPYDDDVARMEIAHVTQESLKEHHAGVFRKTCYRTEHRKTVASFHELSTSKEYTAPQLGSDDNTDHLFWKNCSKTVYYADSVDGTLFDESQTVWNLSKLDTDMNLLTAVYDKSYPGVTSPYLYFGMWSSSFGWHTEDYDLPSINYMHFGMSKIWYSIPPEQGKMLEKVAMTLFPEEFANCETFIRHKITHIHPNFLRAQGIRVNRVEQRAGEFIVTFPFGYHQGYNTGFNCAEAVNFCHVSWLDYGKVSKNCNCNSKFVLDVALYLEVYKPEDVQAWLYEQDDTKVDYSYCPPEVDLYGPPRMYWKDHIHKYVCRSNIERSEKGLPYLQSLAELGSWIVQKNTA